MSEAIAQTKRMVDYSHMDSLDTALAECQYRYVHKAGERTQSELMVLQVGKKLTKFLGQTAYYGDSLGLALRGEPREWDEVSQLLSTLPKGSSTRLAVYDDYPTGQTTYTDGIAMDSYISVEKRVLPAWRIVPDSVKGIMGYRCTMAEAELHGRTWRAWFAPELQMPYGPWLLRGLPGLVVHAYDTEREHDFLLTHITRYGSMIGFNRRSYFKVTREQALQQIKRFYDDAGGFMSQRGVPYSVTNKHGQRVKTPSRPYNPLRRLPR